jgi:nicotinamidase-related amidase
VKPALLVIDVQKEFFQPGSPSARSLESAVEVIKAAIVLFRAKNLPVIIVQHINEKNHVVPGEAGFEIVSDLEILPSDLHILKKHGSSFADTPLLGRLQELNVDTLILSGYCAEYCVLSTYRAAEDLEFTPIILLGSLVSDFPENIRFVERISEVVSLGALEKLIESAGTPPAS